MDQPPQVSKFFVWYCFVSLFLYLPAGFIFLLQYHVWTTAAVWFACVLFCLLNWMAAISVRRKQLQMGQGRTAATTIAHGFNNDNHNNNNDNNFGEELIAVADPSTTTTNRGEEGEDEEEEGEEDGNSAYESPELGECFGKLFGKKTRRVFAHPMVRLGVGPFFCVVFMICALAAFSQGFEEETSSDNAAGSKSLNVDSPILSGIACIVATKWALTFTLMCKKAYLAYQLDWDDDIMRSLQNPINAS